MMKTWFFPRGRWLLGGLMAALALTMGGCSSSTDLPTLPSSFEAEITGDLSLLLSGEAFFADTFEQFDDAPPRRAFMIELQDFGLPPYHAIRLQRLDWGLPAPGSYTLGPAATSAIFTLGYFQIGEEDEEVQVEVSSTSGTLILTEVASNRIRGSFQFEGEGQLIPVAGMPSRTIVVQGSGHFTATRGF